VRTTLTLEDDVVEQLKREMRATGEPFQAVLKSCIRRGLRQGLAGREQPAFRVQSREMGLRPGVSLDKIGALLEQIEGPE
jgi:hypothetical protein